MMNFITIASVLTCLLAFSEAVPAPESHRSKRGIGHFFKEVESDIEREIADFKQPIETGIVGVTLSDCSFIKTALGQSYKELNGSKHEPNLNELKIDFITEAYNITYNITQAARTIPEAIDFNPDQKLYIFIHGFTSDPSADSFTDIRNGLYKLGKSNVLALDGSKLIRWLYLRSSTYVRFMGEKLGEILASMVKNGVDPAQIHMIGHSLGAHIAGFAGKRFANLTEQHVARITGLDPAGPCFAKVDEGMRLKNTDADFVDVIHTDAGVLGINVPVGDVDYFPNEGAKQPGCLFIGCSHGRSWMYFVESLNNPEAFPAVKCHSWKDFEKGSCGDEISYMGFPSKPGTTGKYYLQTAGESPYGLGKNGTGYKNDKGIIGNINDKLFSG